MEARVPQDKNTISIAPKRKASMQDSFHELTAQNFGEDQSPEFFQARSTVSTYVVCPHQISALAGPPKMFYTTFWKSLTRRIYCKDICDRKVAAGEEARELSLKELAVSGASFLHAAMRDCNTKGV